MKYVGVVVCASALVAIGCSASSGGNGSFQQGSGGSGGGGSATGGNTGSGGNPSGQAGTPSINYGGGAGASSTGCNSGPNDDADHDGFTVAQGDCNDCDPNVNPGAYDVPGDGIDEDCDGKIDNAPANCDGNIPSIAYGDPMAAANAIGLCQQTTQGSPKWGVISATYVKADGTQPMNPLSHGLLPGFGPNVHTQEGKALLVLSSGPARVPGEQGYSDVGSGVMGTFSQTPGGFPIDSPSCSVHTANNHIANDPAGLQLQIRVPTNAKSFSFQFDFYTFEYPVYVCTRYNDFFVALQNPAPSSALNGDISFDSKGDPVSVNNGYLEVCSPGTHGGKTFACPQGTSQLLGTGFGGHAATGWLETDSPVTPGSIITLRFAIWDMGDHLLSSTVLIDNFKWSLDKATGPVTKPVPAPK